MIDESRDMEIIDYMSKATGVRYSDEQKEILKTRGDICVLACAGSGKALVNGTKVLTRDWGYVPIETLELGEQVFDGDGKIQTVLGVFPQGKKKVNKVEFIEGNVIECCDEHLWRIFVVSEEGRTFTEVCSTHKISEYLGSGESVYIPTAGRVLGCKHLDVEASKVCHDAVRYGCNSVKCTSVEHAEKVMDVLECWGYMCTLGNKQGEYYVDFCEFPKLSMGIKAREIISIESTGEEKEMTCIQVSGQEGLFLTEHCIVTHNTTVSTHLIAKRILTGEIGNPNRVLYTTYSKSGSIEMEQRLDRLFKQLGIKAHIPVKTIHSFCYNIITHYFPGVYKVIDESQKMKYIREACKAYNISLDEEDKVQLASLISYQSNNLLKDSDTVGSTACRIDISVSDFKNVRTYYSQKKKEANLIDFDDMQVIVWSWLVMNPNRDVTGYCRSLYDYFFFDEAQDMSKIQYEILRSLFTEFNDPSKLEKSVVCVGDDDQSIYKWRGADPAILINICGEFPIKRCLLSTNYRCKSEIVDLAANGVKYNKVRSDKTMVSSETGGKVELLKSDSSDLYNMSYVAFNKIKSLIDSGVPAKDIAVLSRNNFHLAILSNMCLKEGIYCESSADMKLTHSLMYKDIKAIVTLVDNPYNFRSMKEIIWKLVPRLSRSVAEKLGSLMDKNGISFVDLIKIILSSRGYEVGEPECVKHMSPMAIERISNIGITYESLTGLRAVIDAVLEEDQTVGVRVLFDRYINNTEYLYKNPDKARAIRGLIKYYTKMFGQSDFADVLQFMRLSEQYDDSKMASPGYKLTLSTMHGSKGREWEHVILFGDDTVSMPSFSNIQIMSDNGVPMDDIRSYIEEDRRLHYVAMTRAKSDLAIVTAEEMGVYLMECLGAFNTADNDGVIIDMASRGRWLSQMKQAVRETILVPSNKYYAGKE